MSETKKPETTYYIKIEMGQHVPQDSGFYATFDYKELTNGVESLKQSIAIGFNSLQNYLERRMGDGIQNQKS